MKKSSVIWLFVIFVAGFTGYAAGKSHNRPRLLMNRFMLHQILKQPQAPNNQGFKITDDHWDTLKKRFEDYEKSEFIKEETWDSWTANTEVKVLYNTMDGEVSIYCRNVNCTK